ncbi:MAG: Fic family protein [Lentisphaeraceae bacterium]|nr:Fic family protein [Lentisphaeraceae bacterium]
MMWIHEEATWPNFFWEMNELATLLAEVRFAQGRLLGKMESLGFSLQQEASLKNITHDIVKSSAIEGEVLNSEEVRSSVARNLGINIVGLIPTGRDVEGLVQMMLDASQNYSDELTSERLHDWHCALFPTGRSGMHKITVGAWRSEDIGPMRVVSGGIGAEKIHFEAPAASRLDDEMASFLNWFSETNSVLDPVIKAAIAHFYFISIHPFEDGNGRIARAIADLALARSDGTSQRFYSMSSQIELERKEYYNNLEAQQRSGTDITLWISWFLGCLKRAIDSAEDKISEILYKAAIWDSLKGKKLNDRQIRMVNMLLDNFKGYMNSSKYAKLAKCSQDTALRDIHQLLDIKAFVQNPGGGRSTSYRLLTLEEMKEQVPE